MLFQADHVAFSIFPVSSWAEIKAVCASQLADESVRRECGEMNVSSSSFSLPVVLLSLLLLLVLVLLLLFSS
jgi:hypothetical protein